jgi:hypothetical protein
MTIHCFSTMRRPNSMAPIAASAVPGVRAEPNTVTLRTCR